MRNHFLPLELIREILLRLPVRSVLRFKCVCKSWFSLISDPQFVISHYDLAASPTHRILLRSNDSYAQSVDVEAPLNNFAAVHLPLPPRAHFDTYGAFHDTHEILGSCRGLILLFYGKTSDLILWNPSIGVHKRFLDFDYNLIDGYLHGFGYDISTDDYLLILVENFDCSHALPAIKIFSFKTDSWNRVGVNVQYIHADDEEFQAGTLVNGALHWLVYSYHVVEHDDPPSVFDEYVPVIIAFDLIQRTLSEIPLLHPLTNGEYELYSLAVMGGCLSVCCSVQGRRTTEIWVMKEYKVESSWTKSIVIPTCGDYYCDRFSPICITKDGGIFGSNIIGRLEKRNDLGELLESLSYGQGRRVLYEDNLQSAMYRESLLPLPVSSGETSEYDQR